MSTPSWRQVDPDSAERIHPHHSQRLGRALEVYRASGVTMTELFARQSSQPGAFAGYRIVQMAICPTERAVLHQRIAARFEQMMAAGFLDEVQQLYQREDLHPGLPAIRAVGYRQLWQHLAGECSLDEAVDKGIAATRQLAKRQLTWLRKWPDLEWIYTRFCRELVAKRPVRRVCGAGWGQTSGPGLEISGATPTVVWWSCTIL